MFDVWRKFSYNICCAKYRFDFIDLLFHGMLEERLFSSTFLDKTLLCNIFSKYWFFFIDIIFYAMVKLFERNSYQRFHAYDSTDIVLSMHNLLLILSTTHIGSYFSEDYFHK